MKHSKEKPLQASSGKIESIFLSKRHTNVEMDC